jgi:hypothetical protein
VAASHDSSRETSNGRWGGNFAEAFGISEAQLIKAAKAFAAFSGETYASRGVSK